MIFDDLREETLVRLQRETAYVVALAEVLQGKDNTMNRLEAKKLLETQIEDNNKSLKLINEFITTHQFDPPLIAAEATDVIHWQQFVKDHYWEKGEE